MGKVLTIMKQGGKSNIEYKKKIPTKETKPKYLSFQNLAIYITVLLLQEDKANFSQSKPGEEPGLGHKAGESAGSSEDHTVS